MSDPQTPSTGDGIECSLTEQEFENRPKEVWALLVDHYRRAEELESGYRFYFEGTDASLRAAATFISNELECCSFGTYSLTVSSPFEETELKITGPEGTKELFESLVEKLESGQKEFEFEDV